MSNELGKRARAPNFSEEEKGILLHCISKEKNVIENKKTDAYSNKEKCAAWDKITEDFNSNLRVNKRDSKSLRRFWEIEKSKARKGFAKDRRSHMETGGGPEVQQYISETPEVTEIIQPTVDPIIVEIKNTQDSDGIAFARHQKEANSSTFISNYNNISPVTDIVYEVNEEGELLFQTPVNDASVLIIDPVNKNEKPIEETVGIKKPTSVKRSSSSTKMTINEEADLKVKKIKNAIEYETKLYNLQIQHQKIITAG